MKAYILEDRPGLDSLTLAARPIPTVGAGQILLKIKAVSLNYRDLLMINRTYAGGTPFASYIPISDGAGEVVEVGAGVTRFKPGDRAMGAFMPGWVSGDFTPAKFATALGGNGVDGVLTEYIVLPESGAVATPDFLTDLEAATLPCAAVTAWYALFVGANVKAGDTVLTLGTGGVSLFALQFAKAAGAKVILTSSSEEKQARATELGADSVLNYRTVPEWGAAVNRLTDGRGADLVVEIGGPGTLQQSLTAVGYGGTISLLGFLTGAENNLSIVPIVFKQVKVQGVYVGSVEMFEAMNRSITLHGLRPVIDRVFEFDEARAALEHLQSGAHFGKVVIRVGN